MKIRPVGGELSRADGRTGRRTDRYDEATGFRSFACVPKQKSQEAPLCNSVTQHLPECDLCRWIVATEDSYPSSRNLSWSRLDLSCMIPSCPHPNIINFLRSRLRQRAVRRHPPSLASSVCWPATSTSDASPSDDSALTYVTSQHGSWISLHCLCKLIGRLLPCGRLWTVSLLQENVYPSMATLLRHKIRSPRDWWITETNHSSRKSSESGRNTWRFAIQMWVECLAWGICPWAPF